MTFESFKELYNSHGVSLLPIGSRAMGLSREFALEALEHLKDAKIPVSGGQVLRVRNDCDLPIYTPDAWDSEMRSSETYDDYCVRSILEAKSFILTYVEPPNQKVLYEIVLGWGKDLYLMDPDEKP